MIVPGDASGRSMRGPIAHSGDIQMRRISALVFAAAGLAFTAPALAQSQGPAQPQQPPAVQAAPAPKPYATIAVKVAPPPADPSFAAFRKQLGDIASKKDRGGLARLVVAKDFFWDTDAGDKADKKKSGLDNLGAALGGFSGQEAAGWETLEAAAAEPSAEPHGERKNVMCAPAVPQFDEQAFEKAVQDTGSDPGEWGYPVAEGVEVRASAAANAPAIERLALVLVRVLPDESATQEVPFVRIVTPTGRTGYVPLDAIAALASDQICYLKDGAAWKITGYIGGE
jgi:hypothetical protein